MGAELESVTCIGGPVTIGYFKTPKRVLGIPAVVCTCCSGGLQEVLCQRLAPDGDNTRRGGGMCEKFEGRGMSACKLTRVKFYGCAPRSHAPDIGIQST